MNALPAQKRTHQGFTVIEMVLVTSLIAMVGLSVYQALANGLKIWERNQRFAGEEDVAIFLDKVGQDLRQSLSYSQLEFDGSKSSLSFPSIVRTRRDNAINRYEVAYVDQIGMVEYYFDRDRSEILRRQANYGQAVEEKFAPGRRLVGSVHSLDFYYYYFLDSQWSIKRKADALMPAAVRVEVKLREDTGGLRKVTKFILIPWGT